MKIACHAAACRWLRSCRGVVGTVSDRAGVVVVEVVVVGCGIVVVLRCVMRRHYIKDYNMK